MVCMTDEGTRRRVMQQISEHSPRPTELLEIVEGLSYSELQDVIAELLDSGQVELTPGRRLRVRQSAA